MLSEFATTEVPLSITELQRSQRQVASCERDCPHAACFVVTRSQCVNAVFGPPWAARASRSNYREEGRSVGHRKAVVLEKLVTAAVGSTSALEPASQVFMSFSISIRLAKKIYLYICTYIYMFIYTYIYTHTYILLTNLLGHPPNSKAFPMYNLIFGPKNMLGKNCYKTLLCKR